MLVHFALLLFLGTAHSSSSSSSSPNPFLLPPPTGIGRCCYQPGGECLDDSHCTTECVTGGDAYSCKNCKCWTSGTGCCAENFVCTSTGSPNPLTGQCKPYCNGDCHGHGTCTQPNTCACQPGWDTQKDCGTCDSTHYGPECSACHTQDTDSGTMCSGHGTCDGAGTNSGNGTCLCDKGWADNAMDGTKCSTCAKGYGPPEQCTDFVCTQGCTHGTCTAPDVCTCQEGWSGDSCSTTSCANITPEGQPECSGNGKCTAPDVCTCNLHYQGLACEIGNAECCATVVCSDNLKQCNSCCQYPAGHAGACQNAGYSCKGCDCGVKNGKGTQGCCGGSYCQQDSTSVALEAKEPQTIRGTTVLLGENAPVFQCCPVNKAGLHCNTCATGYYGPKCVPCPGGTPAGTNQNTCSGHGLCTATGTNAGTCDCDFGYNGHGCSVCDASAFHCVNDCNNHGTCACPKASTTHATNSTHGQCVCKQGYAGDSCQSCESGYWNKKPESCVPCVGCALCDSTTGQCLAAPSPRSGTSPTPRSPGGGPTSIGGYVLYGMGGGVACLFVGSAFMWVLRRSGNSNNSNNNNSNNKNRLLGLPDAPSNTYNSSINNSGDYNPPSIAGGSSPSMEHLPSPELLSFPSMPNLPSLSTNQDQRIKSESSLYT